MTIRAITNNDLFDFSSRGDEDEVKTVFKCRVLTASEFASCGVAFQSEFIMTVSQAFSICTIAVRDIENFTDEAGNPIRIPQHKGRADHKIINKIPMPVVVEIASEVLKRSNLDEADQKN